jgi:nicotinamidase-related amidase
MSKEHLIVSDMQTGLISRDKVNNIPEKVQTLQEIISGFRARGVPITFTMFPEYHSGPLIPELLPVNTDELVMKDESDAFSSPKFIERVNGADLLYVTGCNLHVCIRLTVDDAVQRGMTVVIFNNATFASNYYPMENLQTQLHFLTSPNIGVVDY